MSTAADKSPDYIHSDNFPGPAADSWCHCAKWRWEMAWPTEEHAKITPASRIRHPLIKDNMIWMLNVATNAHCDHVYVSKCILEEGIEKWSLTKCVWALDTDNTLAMDIYVSSHSFQSIKSNVWFISRIDYLVDVYENRS